MSLSIVISAEEQVNSFFVYNCTGKQHHDNPGGFGGTNPSISDIQSATLTITAPDQHLPTHLTPGQIDSIIIAAPTVPIYTITVSPNFPNIDDELGYEVLPYMVGNNQNTIPSGKWRITLTVEGTFGPTHKPFKASGFVDKVFIKTVTCCVDKLQKYVNVQNYKDKKSQTIKELNNLLVDAEYNIGCGLLDQANGIIRLLVAQCECPDC